jgi:mannose-1-phosphate guanylyltransferase
VTSKGKASGAAVRSVPGGRVEPGRRYAIVMAGGSGTRFWPWSREDVPKQLLALVSSRSMLAETVARLRGIVPRENIFVVTGRRHRRRVAAELPGLASSQVLAEPVGRNTAAAIGWASLEIRRSCPDAVTAVLSADHRIDGAEAYRRDLETAFAVADRSRGLVTFGIRPEFPATGYGYILAAAGSRATAPAQRVAAFVEKPDLATARRYVAGGRHYWNSGMFVWRADVILDEMRVHVPELANALSSMDRARVRGRIPGAVLAGRYPRLPSISIDYAVLEKSDRVSMLAASFGWSDIGSWDSVAGLWPSDASGNSTRDPLLAVDAAGNVVATRGKPVVLLGVDDLVVVDAGDVLLVCPRARCQDVRSVPGLLAEAGLGELR